MNITDILDMMDDMLDKSWNLPFSGGRCVVDVERLREMVGDIRLNMPTEVKQAKMIVQDRKQIIDDAKAEAEEIVRKAQERTRAMVTEEEIVKQAQARANEILSTAQSQSREMKRATSDFADRLLSQLEEQLIKDLNGLKETRQAVRKMK